MATPGEAEATLREEALQKSRASGLSEAVRLTKELKDATERIYGSDDS
ncbi:MAG TPA: hypothetical protein VLI05_00200 [Candidatus Saccharimonadia bacterium]|nr:hypothetical protein [Candidatus Saccharimonadia bacterium]